MDPTGPDSAAPRRPGILLILPLAGIVLALLVVFGALRSAPSFHGTPWDPPQAAADFELVDHTGQLARLSDHRGKTVLLFFGFVNCPDVCPLTLTRLSSVLRDIGADTSQVSVLLVTVDPERDTPESLAAYVTSFGPHVTGLTGDAETLARVRASFHAHAASHDGHDGQRMVNHTTQVFGIDRAGQIRVLISPEFNLDTVKDDVRTLMKL
ncbi:SCO family protein [soil metagenome]